MCVIRCGRRRHPPRRWAENGRARVHQVIVALESKSNGNGIARIRFDGGCSHWRDCHFADALSPSLLKHLQKGEGSAAE